MRRIVGSWCLPHSITMLVLLFAVSAPHTSHADKPIERGLFEVSISLGGQTQTANTNYLARNPTEARLRGSTSRDRQLPDSLHFAGLAGTLNLVIDKSNGTPLVDGIELAPRETLRIIADDNSGIRGLHGQISIRLDF